MTQDTQLVVVGLGLMGSAAVRHATVAGAEVVGIGPGEPGDWSSHDGPFASHYDSGRITRLLDSSPIWAELARRSIEQYPVIASGSGLEFHHPVGVLWVSGVAGGLSDLEPVARLMEVDVAARRFGDLDSRHFGFGADDESVLEPSPAGHINPRVMLVAQQRAAVAGGATLLDEVVERVERRNDGVTIWTRGGGRVDAGTAVVAAGAYTGLLPGVSVPIAPTTEAVVLAEVSEATAAEVADLPCVIHSDRAGGMVDVYMVPPVRYPDGRWYVKLGAETEHDHFLGDPEAITAWMGGSGAESRRDLLVDAVTRMLPGMAFERFIIKPCIYARTQSLLPYVDHLSERIVVAAGGNGRAAKSADAIGDLAVRLALTGDWDDPLSSASFALPV